MKFNKAAACLVATACTASVLGAMTSVSAAGDVTIKAESKTVKPGTFTVDVMLENVPSSGICGLDFAVKYDTSLVEIVSVEAGAISTEDSKKVEGVNNLNTNDANGALSVVWATGEIDTNSTWIKKDGVLLTLNCKSKGNGEAKFEITKGVRKDATSIDVAVADLAVVAGTGTAGTVKITEETTPATTEPSAVTTPSPSKDPGETGETKLGDVNCDGKIDITDISVLAVALVDKKELTGQSKINADVNKDGEVALADLATIKSFISKIIKSFE